MRVEHLGTHDTEATGYDGTGNQRQDAGDDVNDGTHNEEYFVCQPSGEKKKSRLNNVWVSLLTTLQHC